MNSCPLSKICIRADIQLFSLRSSTISRLRRRTRSACAMDYSKARPTAGLTAARNLPVEIPASRCCGFTNAAALFRVSERGKLAGAERSNKNALNPSPRSASYRDVACRYGNRDRRGIQVGFRPKEWPFSASCAHVWHWPWKPVEIGGITATVKRFQTVTPSRQRHRCDAEFRRA